MIQIFPAAASTIASAVDELAWAHFALGLVGFTLVVTLLVVLSLRFRVRTAPTETNVAAADLEHNPRGVGLEIVWTVTPFVIFMALFFWGASLFVTMRRPPDNALEVFAVGRRWMWKLQHLEGKREINSLHVPVGQPVRVVLTSEDVIHSFFVPAFRVKQDAVPGRYTDLWFEATQPGRYHLFCTEYCGTQHARMIGEVIALEPAEYQAWLAGESAGVLSMAEAGRELFGQLGCPTCHVTQGAGRGPGLAGLFGRRVRLADGREVVADDDYLRRSILDPAGQLVAGYQPIMPTYKGLISEESLLQLIAYMRSLEEADAAGAEPGGGTGAAPAQGRAAAHSTTREAG